MPHCVKIGADLTAVGVNLWCVLLVVKRHRRGADSESLRRQARLIRATAWVGLPFAAVAFCLGFVFFLR